MTFAIGPNGCVMDYVECEVNFFTTKKDNEWMCGRSC